MKTPTPALLIKMASLIALVLCFGTKLQASTTTDNFQPNLVIGDGKSGNRFSTWTQNIQNVPVDSIVIRIKKLKGNDTFLNFRFQGGETFENGRRVYLEGSGLQTLTWQLNGELPKNRPLLLQSYHGEVLVESVQINYVTIQEPSVPQPPLPDNENISPRPWNPSPGDSDPDNAVRACRKTRARPPIVRIENLEPSRDRYSDEYRIEGTIQGQCVEEVGYYERGRLREPIRFPLDDRFIRREFQLRIVSRERPEIRVYTADGQQQVVDLEDEIDRFNHYRN